jgi:hypothetical protein
VCRTYLNGILYFAVISAVNWKKGSIYCHAGRGTVRCRDTPSCCHLIVRAADAVMALYLSIQIFAITKVCKL